MSFDTENGIEGKAYVTECASKCLGVGWGQVGVICRNTEIKVCVSYVGQFRLKLSPMFIPWLHEGSGRTNKKQRDRDSESNVEHVRKNLFSR